jgi:hypothetical protein
MTSKSESASTGTTGTHGGLLVVADAFTAMWLL